MPVTQPAHEIRVVDGRFAHAECSCGWRSAARRERRAVRRDAHDHALLYADGRPTPVVPPVTAPAPRPRSSV